MIDIRGSMKTDLLAKLDILKDQIEDVKSKGPTEENIVRLLRLYNDLLDLQTELRRLHENSNQ